ncbi:MAG: hypothetical protein KC502_22700 [Myxococcales bacterium]|nr:hypothetical protein [Myxococcales bacterium]
MHKMTQYVLAGIAALALTACSDEAGDNEDNISSNIDVTAQDTGGTDGGGGTTDAAATDVDPMDVGCSSDVACPTSEEACLVATCGNDGTCAAEPAKAGTPCDDGDWCTSKDACSNGKCVGGKLTCDDGHACTDDSCDEDEGCLYINNASSCDDGDKCTEKDRCKDGQCAAGGPLKCVDDDPCTDDTCDKDKGCLHMSNTAPCSDDKVCTTKDMCVGGKCVGGAMQVCNDDNPCTEGACNEPDNGGKGGCVALAKAATCSDNNVCTTDDTCQNGKCTPGTKSKCDDGNPCTTESCEKGKGCQFTNNVEKCSDGSVCTQGDVCKDGKCAGAAQDCDDKNPCTTDGCDKDKGCASDHKDGTCDDGNPCTTGDTCKASSCIATQSAKCDDGNPCTTDSCDKTLGCQHKIKPGPCWDPPKCTPPLVPNLSGVGCSHCLPKEVKPALDKIWAHWRPKLTASIKVKHNPTVLYNAQGFTNNLLRAATACKDLARLDEIAAYLLAAFEHIGTKPGYKTWVDTKGVELNTLSVSQFLYMVSETIHVFATLPKAQRTASMQALMAKAPVVLLDHYRRWIIGIPRFNTHGWGCDGGAPLNPHEALSLTAWVRTTQSKGTVLLTSGTRAELKVSGGKLVARLITDSPNPTKGDKYTVYEITGGKVSDGAWHHLALTFDSAAGLLVAYVDGKQVAKTITKGKYWPNTGQAFVGGYTWSSGGCCFLKAAIDDARLYGRALAASEVSACAGAKTCSAKGLRAHWPLDGDGKDVAGQNHLEQVNGASFVAGKLGKAAAFDGVKGEGHTHNWYGPQTHLYHLRGKAIGMLKDSPNDPDYCHAVLDKDMWIFTGLVQMLAARSKEPSLVSLPAADEAALKAYLSMAVDLMQKRLQNTTVKDFAGKAVGGAVPEPGMYDQHVTHAYTGYSGTTFPTLANKKGAKGVGWDLSHARRLVHVYETLYRHKAITGKTFPTIDTMKRLANQFAYVSFNKNLSAPLFHNFIDGTNGWYRVGYHGPGFGYAPFDISMAGPTGGYGFWKKYNPDIQKINLAMWHLMTTKDPKLIAHRKAHYGTYYKDHKRVGSFNVDMTTSLDMLYFLPTFALDQ